MNKFIHHKLSNRCFEEELSFENLEEFVLFIKKSEHDLIIGYDKGYIGNKQFHEPFIEITDYDGYNE